METGPNDVSWHPEVVTPATLTTLSVLHNKGLLTGTYLAGGTALALHLGHRLSVDLDFFINELFDQEAMLQRIQEVPEFSLVAKAPHTLHANIQGTKVSFLGYQYPLLFPLVLFMGVPVADARDIACMKISAIASRGTKRDFIDLYLAASQYGLGHLFDLFQRKYVKTGYSRLHILKSLAFFDDAEKDPMPHMLVPMNWQAVKLFFKHGAVDLP
ncbi:MAG: nucleotidyl transferase AbiEii/AbiGii toxin family protein [Acidobacteriota bacterium]|nr:nucleotidyl transferase AbiEii/AbiGii toxin family protein [Acidobacteriota bacterium]